MKTNNLLLLAFAGVLLGLVSCKSKQSDTRIADEKAIRTARQEWSSAYQKKDLQKPLSYVAEEANMFPPNLPVLYGKEAINKSIAYMFSLPGFALSFNVTKVEVAQANDLAYEEGTYQLTLNDAAGKPVTTPGKYVVVWKKQKDSTWKVVADIFNADK